MGILEWLLPLLCVLSLAGYGTGAYRHGWPSPVRSRYERTLERIERLEIDLGFREEYSRRGYEENLAKPGRGLRRTPGSIEYPQVLGSPYGFEYASARAAGRAALPNRPRVPEAIDREALRREGKLNPRQHT